MSIADFEICVVAIYGVIIGICFVFTALVIYAPVTIKWMKSGEWRKSVEGWREKIGRVGRIERLDRIWTWLKLKSAGWKAEVVDTEELEHLDSHDAEGREGSVSGETLFESEGDEDGDEQVRKKEEMDLDSEDYMVGEPGVQDKKRGRHHR